MPPRRAKKTEEQLEAEYSAWSETPESTIIDELNQQLKAVPLDNALVDIINTRDVDYQKFLTTLMQSLLIMKVPSKNKKNPYDNAKLRTIYFENKTEITIDGTLYEISLAAKTDVYNAKMKLYTL
jgi:hypothetical protein